MDTLAKIGKSMSNISAGFVDGASSFVTFGNWSTRIGQLYEGRHLGFAYGVGHTTAQVTGAIALGAGAGALAARAFAGVPALAGVAEFAAASRAGAATVQGGIGAVMGGVQAALTEGATVRSVLTGIVAGGVGGAAFGALGYRPGAVEPAAPPGTAASEDALQFSNETADDGLKAARAARDAKAAEAGSSKATVTGGYGKDGIPRAGCSSNPIGCAEEDVARKIGGNPRDINFTEAVRPRTGEQVPICWSCQNKFEPSQFPPGTEWKPGCAWDNR